MYIYVIVGRDLLLRRTQAPAGSSPSPWQCSLCNQPREANFGAALRERSTAGLAWQRRAP